MTTPQAPPRSWPEHPLRGAPAGVATRHAKTAVLDEILGGPGGLRLHTVPVDTDVFGTFAGDRPRPDTPQRVVVAKAWTGAREGGYDVGLASEGSFGPDPSLPLVTVQHELVGLVQRSSGLVVVGRAAAPAPWVVALHIAPEESVRRAARRVSAATAAAGHHPLLVRPDPIETRTGEPGTGGPGVSEARLDQTGRGITRAVVGERQLVRAITHARRHSPQGQVLVSSDLRAHVCAPRLVVIRRAAADLAARLARRCHRCGSPGVGRARVERGRPCRCCGTPTDEVVAVVDQCPACAAETRRAASRPGGADCPPPEVAPRDGDPAWCPRCNP